MEQKDMNRLIFLIGFLFLATSCECQNFFWSHTGQTEPEPCTEGYGLLYNRYVIDDARKITSSDDWIVPQSTHFSTFQTYVGGSTVGGGRIKETGTTYWDSPNTGATNQYGYNFRGGGGRLTSGVFSSINQVGAIWLNWFSSPNYVYAQANYNNDDFTTGATPDRFHGRSLRLVYVGAGTPSHYTGNDGKVYRVVLIGSQYWLADNLQDTHFRNGDIIPYHGADNDSTFTNAEWAALTTSGVCAYNNDVSNVGCDFSFPEMVSVNYGYLYNWYVTQGTGATSLTSSDEWIVPSESDMDAFASYVGGTVPFEADNILDATWTPSGGTCTPTNTLKFSARGSGNRSELGVYGNEDVSGLYWASTSFNTTLARYREIYCIIYGDGVVQNKAIGMSIRLLYTGAGTPTQYVGNDGKVYSVILIGTQYWLANNLCETKLRGGTAIPEVTDNATWAGLTTGARCSYNNDESNAINP